MWGTWVAAALAALTPVWQDVMPPEFQPRRVCGCPLQTLEARLAAFARYERLTWRGFPAADAWRLLVAAELQPSHSARTSPNVGHLRLSRSEPMRMSLPRGTRCLLIVRLMAYQHVFFSDCSPSQWPRAIEALWQLEARAARAQCRRTKCEQ